MKLTAFSALVVASLLGVAAHAQAPADLRGTYTRNAAASDDVNRAIDAAISSMSFATRPIARSRLRKTSPIYQNVTIAFDSARISTRFEERVPIVAPASGAVVKWKRDDGEVFDLSTRTDGTTMTQTFRARDGMRENTYALQLDGVTLRLHVKLTSPRLPRPVEYTLVYERSHPEK